MVAPLDARSERLDGGWFWGERGKDAAQHVNECAETDDRRSCHRGQDVTGSRAPPVSVRLPATWLTRLDTPYLARGAPLIRDPSMSGIRARRVTASARCAARSPD